MNALQVGSEVHLKYELTEKPLLGNSFSQTLGISNNELADVEYYRVESDLPLNTYAENVGEFYSITKAKVDNKYIVQINPTKKAYLFEGDKIESAFVMVSNASSWKQLNELMAPPYQRAIEATLPPQFQKIANDAAQITDTKDQIEFVSREISKLVSYSSDWSEVSGVYFPQGHAKVLKNGKGDCKDYSTSMVAILRKLHLVAYPAVTFRSARYLGSERIKKMAELPSLQNFNHIIVWAKDKKGKIWWVDPTNPIVIADVLSADILGNYSLILDSVSNQASLLPERNAMPADLSLEQKISVQPDNSVIGLGTINMSLNMYNQIGMQERNQGLDATKKMFSTIINATSKIQMNLNKDSKNQSNYSFSFRASDWMQEQKGKFRGIVLMNPVGLLLSNMQPKSEGDLGEPGSVKMLTHIANEKQVDSIGAGCVIRSPWLDFDRVVENRQNEILVTDTISIKQRYISKEVASTDEFEINYDSVLSCYKKSFVLLSIDPSIKTLEMAEQEKLKGTPIENMTDADAVALEAIRGPKLSGYSAHKRYRYYSNKLEKNPQDAEAYYKRATAIRFLGYIKNDEYESAYLVEANQNLDLAIKYSGEAHFNPLYYKNKIFNLLGLKKVNEASDLFKVLYAKAPGDFNTYLAAFRVSNVLKSFMIGEMWLRGSENLAKTEEQKDEFHREMGFFLTDHRREREAIPHKEYFLAKDPKNPWALHNLAVDYSSIKEYDKAIDLEKKALEISDFGAARDNLAKSYYNKAAYMAREPNARSPASEEKQDALILEALKWEQDYLPALRYMAKHCLDIYIQAKEPLKLMQGRSFLDRAIEKQPNDPELLSLLNSYKSLQGK